MTNEETFLLFILLPTTALAQIPAVSTFNENDIVQCFNDITSCNANSNVMMITAGQCCNSTGGSSRHVRVVSGNNSTCSNCFVVTFSQRSYSFGPENRGETVPFPITVFYFSGTGNYNVTLSVNNNPDPLPNGGRFISRFSTNNLQYSLTTTSQNFSMTLVTSGNNIALEDALNFTLVLSVTSSSFSDYTVIVLSSTNVIIDDLDIIRIRFDKQKLYEVQESSERVSVKINRDTIQLVKTFYVTITTREFSGDPTTLTRDQSTATPNIDYINGETVTMTFIADTEETERTFEFTILNDKTVELDELFDLVITVSDPRVIINGDVGYVVISDDDKFSIGFNQTEYIISEGENITLTVMEYHGFIGGVARGGVPEDRLLRSFLLFSNGNSSADENVDFIINKTLPQFTYSPNNTINNISVPFHSLSDNVLERFEIAVLEIRLNQTDHFIQIHNSIVQFVTVTILDNTVATVKLSANKYNTSESVGGVQVCADLINATLGSDQSLQVNFVLNNGSALWNQDYSLFNIDPRYFTFIASSTQVCVTIRIRDDNIREPLLEFFNITLLPYDPITSPTPGYTGLTVDTTPSIIYIEDDDAEVRFEQSSVTFSEADGDQNIYVILDGRQISNNKTVELYDIKTNQTFGILTIVSGAPPQRQTVVFPVVNNNIALELDKLTQLGLRNYSILQIDNPFTMNVTVVDDDVVTAKFSQSLYSYNEDHGVVSDINVVLSNEIAQDLNLTVSGGPGIQPSTVEISGVNINQTMTFTAHGAQFQGLPSFTIINDTVALETIEQYSFSVSNPSITNGVTLGPDSTIQITDDDVVTVNFSQSLYSYSENHGVASDITIILSTAIAQSLTVTVSGGPGTQPLTVEISGVNVNEMITLVGRGSQSQGLSSFIIINDTVALETTEQYGLSFSNPSIISGVTLGPDTTIQIMDDDAVTVNFSQSLYSYSENHGVVSDITITLSTTIAQILTVTVSGGPGIQIPTVEISGININSTITFIAQGSRYQELPTFTIIDDTVPLETTEQYNLSLRYPSITNDVTLGPDTIIHIIDDDVNAEILNKTGGFVTKNKGQNVTFNCTAEGVPQPVIVWRKNGQILSNTSRVTIVSLQESNGFHTKYIPTTSVIIIINLRGNDNGNYSCRADNAVKTGSVLMTPYVLQVVESLPTNYCLNSPCRKHGKCHSLSNGYMCDCSSGYTGINCEHVTPLIVRHFKPPATNIPLSPGTQIPPNVTIDVGQDAIVANGTTVLIRCSITQGSPPLYLKWYKDGSQFLSGDSDPGTLRLDVVVLRNSGIYECRVSNAYGNDAINSTLSVYVNAEVLNKIGGFVTKNKGQNVTFNCTADGVPQPVILWRKNGQLLLNTSRVTIVSSQESNDFHTNYIPTTSVIIIKDLRGNDNGSYSCRADNAVKTGSILMTPYVLQVVEPLPTNYCLNSPCGKHGKCHSLSNGYICDCSSGYTGINCEQVVVIYILPKIIQPPRNTPGNLYSTVNLTCRATGNPIPTILWYKNDVLISNDNNDPSVLMFTELNLNNRGFYHCEAKSLIRGNIISVNSSSVILNISDVVQYKAEMKISEDYVTTNITVLEIILDIINQSNSLLSGRRLYSLNTFFLFIQLLGSNNINYTAQLNTIPIVVTLVTKNEATEQLRVRVQQQLTTLSVQIKVNVSFDKVERFDGCPATNTTIPSHSGRHDLNITILWPEANIGVQVIRSCPCGNKSSEEGGILQATRYCGGDFTSGAMWTEPNVAACNFSDLTREICGLRNAPVAKKVKQLENLTSNSSRLGSTEVIASVSVLITATEDVSGNFTLSTTFLEVVDNIISVNQNTLQTSQTNSNTSAKMLEAIESVVESIPISNISEPVIITQQSFAVSVQQVNIEEFTQSGQRFSVNYRGFSNGNQTLNSNDLVFGTTSQQSMATISLPNNLLSTIPNITNNTRITHSVFTTESLFLRRINNFLEIGSIIISTTVVGIDTISGLDPPVGLSFQINPNLNGSSPQCSFWNQSLDNGYGDWSNKGCHNTTNNKTEILCECNHLTNFAILMDVSPVINEPIEQSELTLLLDSVTYIGIIVSIFCLTITIISYFANKKLRTSEHGQLLLNLCFALMGLYIAFIFAVHSRTIPFLCAATAAVLQYFFLVTFMVMAAEAINLYMNLVIVLGRKIHHFVLKATISSWITPLFIVLFCFAPNCKNYLSDHFCRAFNEPYYIGMIVPFLIIYLFNWVVFIIIIVSLLRKNFQSDIKTKNNNNITFVRQQLLITVTLSILLGLGWGIGLLATQDIHTNKTVRDLFAALFVILTAFHGLFIFIMHCLRSKEVRNTWKRWFYGATGKDFNELTSSAFFTKQKKHVPSTTGGLRTTIGQQAVSVSETALESMKTESKIEGVVSAETTFIEIEDENEKKMLEAEEEKQYQSQSVSNIQDS